MIGRLGPNAGGFMILSDRLAALLSPGVPDMRAALRAMYRRNGQSVPSDITVALNEMEQLAAMTPAASEVASHVASDPAPDTSDDVEWISTAEAGQRKGVTEKAVRDAGHRDVIVVQRFGRGRGVLKVDAESLGRWTPKRKGA
jgi:hypothetical protein